MAQVNLEADTAEELDNWIDQYPPPIAANGINQCCHTEKQHHERIATYGKIDNRGNQQNRSGDNLVLRCELSQLFPIEEDQSTSDKVNRIINNIASSCAEIGRTQPVKHNVTVDYAFQDINDIPGTLPEGRTKPWGTGQAVLAAKNVIDTPFIVINADDYYGKEGFKAVHEYLVNGGKSCMAGFVLKNTLSDNGGVTRGICKMDEQNNLTEVVETKNIVKTATGAEADGVAVDVNSLVSMNMWGLTPEFLDVLEDGFKEFFEKEVPGNPLKAEYLIPIFIGELLEQGKMSVKVLKTNDTWYGMTYHEDVAAVKDSFKKMLENGVYKADLFSDL